MSKIPFPKGYKSPEQIVALLKERGLEIKDEHLAEQTLKSIGYYRFSAYLYPLIAAPKEAQQFKPKSTFERALSLYNFDQELRLFLFRAIAEVEVAVRAAVANIVARVNRAIFSGLLTKRCSSIRPFSPKRRPSSTASCATPTRTSSTTSRRNTPTPIRLRG